ncbi:MAG TPA: hypothetical protein VFQ59_02200 [Candidatus Paceibacterota bacterium]|nr:hypothetical protein [Candidatus Paceibacterota bacterium]
MVDPELISYIRSAMSEGQAKEKILADLESHGWAKEEIAEAYTRIENPLALEVPERVPHFRKDRPFLWLKVLIPFLILLALIFLAVQYYFEDVMVFLGISPEALGEIIDENLQMLKNSI